MTWTRFWAGDDMHCERRDRQQHRRRGRKQRMGTLTIEMAVVAPVIFLIVFGSVEFCRMMMVRHALTDAARQGCRHATLATTQTAADAEAVLREELQGVIASDVAQDTARMRVDFSPNFIQVPGRGTEITVGVEVDCADVTWLPALFMAGARIRGTATMTRE